MIRLKNSLLVLTFLFSLVPFNTAYSKGVFFRLPANIQCELGVVLGVGAAFSLASALKKIKEDKNSQNQSVAEQVKTICKTAIKGLFGLWGIPFALGAIGDAIVPWFQEGEWIHRKEALGIGTVSSLAGMYALYSVAQELKWFKEHWNKKKQETDWGVAKRIAKVILYAITTGTALHAGQYLICKSINPNN